MSEQIDNSGSFDSASAVEEFLNEETTTEPEKATVTEVESENEETEETDEEVIEIPEETEETEDEVETDKVDETEYLSPVRRAEILKAYPDLFKKFPYLERAYYGNQQFREIYPTIADAKEAKEAADTLKNFERDIMQGSTKNLLKSIKDGSPQVFNKIADNYLKDLYDTDTNTYHAIVGNLFNTLARNMVTEAETSGNDALKSAAVIMNQFLFGDSKLRPITKFAKEEPQNDQLTQERMQFAQERYQVAFEDVSTKINNRLKSIIDENIDKNGSMSDYVKKNVTRECLETTHKLIGQDKQFLSHMAKLWDNALRNNYSSESLAAIRKAYDSKAQTVLPSVIKKGRNEALGSNKVKVKEGQGNRPNKTPVTPGRTATSRNSNGKKEVPKGMSDADFLMSD